MIAMFMVAATPFVASAQLNSNWVAINRAGDYSNQEAECYNPANVQVTGGNLVITSKVQAQTCGDATHSPSQFQYTSGMVQWSSFNFTYGTVEFRAKTAGGAGSWPALWLLGANCQTSNVITADNVGTCNWPNSGSEEIDILEMLNDNYLGDHHNMFTAGYVDACSQPVTDTSQNWHVYDMVWAPGSVSYSVDGVAAPCSHASHVPSSPMFLIINNAMGGQGGPVNNSNFPQTMEVDYVKVTQNGNTIFDDEFGGTTGSACDLNNDGVVNSADVQISVSQSLGESACGSADLDKDGICNVIDVQRVVNASLGQACRVGL